MSWLRESQDHLPLTWWKGHPIYLAAILGLIGGASIIFTALVGPQGAAYLVFDYANFVDRHFLWTLLTYAWVNPPSLWSVVGCIMLWRFGEPVERHLGRRAFVRLAMLLLALQPILILLLGLLGFQRALAGITALEFGVFIGFATLYPRAQLYLFIATIEVWLLAAILLGVYALSCLFDRDWLGLLMLAAETGVAFGFIRHEQGIFKLPSFKLKLPGRPAPLRREGREERPYGLPPRPVAPKRPRRRAPARSPEVDDILDKISREGMQSLTPEERVILERASDDLQKRQRP